MCSEHMFKTVFYCSGMKKALSSLKWFVEELLTCDVNLVEHNDSIVQCLRALIK